MVKLSTLFTIAIVIGLIYFLPHAIFYSDVDPSRVYYPFSFAETLYAVQVKEVLEGHWTVGDPQFWEHKYTFPPVFPIIPIWLIAGLSIVVGSVAKGFLIADFVFPTILFLVLAGFIYSILNKKWPAIFIAVATLTLYQLTSKVPPLSSVGWFKLFRQLLLLDVTQPLSFYRTPNPQVSFIFLVLAIWFLWLLWQKFTWLKYWLALTFASSLYAVYFYHATYFLGVLGILEGIALLMRRRVQSKVFLSLLLLMFVIAMGYLYLTGQPRYAALVTTGGRFDARYFDWLFSLRYGVVLLLILCLRRYLKNDLIIFLSAFVGAAIGVMNFQLFSGWTIQPGHWPQTTIEPFMLVVCGITLFSLTPVPVPTKSGRYVVLGHHVRYPTVADSKTKKLPMYIGRVLTSAARSQTQLAKWGTLLLLGYAVLVQIRFTMVQRGQWSIPKDLNYVYAWLNEYAPEQSVVVSLDVETLAYLPILTSNNIFIPVEEYHYATIEEIWERLMYAYKLYSVPLEKFNPDEIPLPTYFELTYNINQYKHFAYSEYSREIVEKNKNCYPSLCSSLYALPYSVEKELRNNYTRINSLVNYHQVDYAIYSDREKKIGAMPPPGKIVFSSGSYQVYQLSLPQLNNP